MTNHNMTNNHLTGSDNYFENFEPGAVYKHARGKTVTENEAVTFCHLVMNTADAHFNDARMVVDCDWSGISGHRRASYSRVGIK